MVASQVPQRSSQLPLLTRPQCNPHCTDLSSDVQQTIVQLLAQLLSKRPDLAAWTEAGAGVMLRETRGSVFPSLL